MSYLKLSIIVLIITTVLICLLNPRLHKRVVIGDLNVAVVPQQEQLGQQTQSIKYQQPKKIINNTLQKQSSKKQIAPNLVSTSSQQHNVLPVPPEAKTQPIQLKPQNQIKPQQKQITQEEAEIIAWNKWRSDLQNRVMRDTKIRAPIGTVFKFSFTVDREGTISNLKTWAQNPDYTPMAVHVIKPTILSYQGQSILNFPSESKRVITNVNGGFTVWYSAGYSSPTDYSDYERVK